MTGEEDGSTTTNNTASGGGNNSSAIGGVLNMMKSHRAPPPLKLDVQPYLMWKKDIEIWQLLTSLPTEKQGLDLYVSLEQKYKAFVNLSVAELKQSTGVEKILDKLDELLLKDKDTLAYEAYKQFDMFRKVGEMSMVEYINKFDQLYNKAAEYDLTMGTGVLAYLLLKGASLSNNDIKIVRLSLPKLDYSSMKKQLLSVSASCVSAAVNEEVGGPSLLPPQKKVKTEDFTDEAQWNSSNRGRGGYHGSSTRGAFHGNPSRGGYQGSSGRGRGNHFASRGRGRGRGVGGMGRGNATVHQNPIDYATGNPMKCFKCGKTDHFARYCPNNNYTEIKDDENNNDEALMVITLLEVDDHETTESESYEVFLCETDCAAILDTACTRTCCGEGWLSCYLDTLTEDELSKVEYSDTSRRYKFGSGEPVEANKAVTFPCSMAGVDVRLTANIVPSRVPLLLSKESMKKAKMVIDIGNDKAKIFDRTVQLDETSSGHYCIYLSKSMEKLKKFNTSVGKQNPEIALYCTVPLREQDEKQIKASALKLHRQFGHAPSAKLRKLVTAAGEGSENLLKSLDDISEHCETCKRYKRAPPRPVDGGDSNGREVFGRGSHGFKTLERQYVGPTPY
jgi:hypothetical protein